jgi:hypothetical protein
MVGSVCKVGTQDPENLDVELKPLGTAWRPHINKPLTSYRIKDMKEMNNIIFLLYFNVQTNIIPEISKIVTAKCKINIIISKINNNSL